MEAIVVAAIGPLLTAGLAALGFVLRRRLHEHDLKTRHERAVHVRPLKSPPSSTC